MLRNGGGCGRGWQQGGGVCPAQHPRRVPWGDSPRASLLLPPPGAALSRAEHTPVRRLRRSRALVPEGDGWLLAPRCWGRDRRAAADGTGPWALPGAGGAGCFQWQ